MITDYQAKYYAHCLTREGGEGPERLQQSLLSASVDLNPHQIEAALFALHSPLSKGCILADEVGLGKTIEAGLILCQLDRPDLDFGVYRVHMVLTRGGQPSVTWRALARCGKFSHKRMQNERHLW